MKPVLEDGRRRQKKGRHLDMLSNCKPRQEARQSFLRPAYAYTQACPDPDWRGDKTNGKE